MSRGESILGWLLYIDWRETVKEGINRTVPVIFENLSDKRHDYATFMCNVSLNKDLTVRMI